MKKKIYMIPVTEVVEVEIQQQVLAGSMPYGESTEETSGNLSREDEDLWEE